MIKKLLTIASILAFLYLPASAQSFHAEISYRSFKPFINFQLELGSQRNYINPYKSSYLKGYMDGVNATRYADYRFYDLVYDIEAYEAGYRDGFRDQQLLCRLRGYNRLPHRPFSYNDYYSPYYSVQIWLNQLSFTFIKAPAHRLPRYWSHRAHPRAIRYRARLHNQQHFSRFQKKHRKRLHQLKKRARYTQKRYRQQNRHHRNHISKKRYNRGESDRNRVQKRERNSKRFNRRGHHSRPKHRSNLRNKSRAERKIKRAPRIRRKNVQSRSKSRTHKSNIKRKRSRRQEIKQNRRKDKPKKVRSRSQSRRTKVKGSRSSQSKSKKRRGGSNRKRDH